MNIMKLKLRKTQTPIEVRIFIFKKFHRFKLEMWLQYKNYSAAGCVQTVPKKLEKIGCVLTNYTHVVTIIIKLLNYIVVD
jgi:hypothetical protein